MTLLKKINSVSADRVPKKESKVILFLPERYNRGMMNPGKGMNSMPYNSMAKFRIKEIQKTLSEQDKIEFNNNIIDAVFDYFETGSDENLKNIIESWDATAEIILDEDAQQRIKKAEKEFDNGEFILWDPDTM